MLIAAIDTSDLLPFRFEGWTGKRLTVSYGWTYDFDAGRLGRGYRLASVAGDLCFSSDAPSVLTPI